MRSRGFSLIELMVVVSILAVIGAVAFAGMRQNQFKGQFTRFVDDVRGVLVAARNYAIEEQTPVRVDVQDDEVLATAYDPVDGTWDPIDRVALQAMDDALLMVDDRVCIYGFSGGVQTPAQFQDIDPPEDCLGGQQRLVFAPDGTFQDPAAAFSVDNAGVSLWIGDRSVPGAERRAVVQIFPGGLIRAFDKIGMDE